MRTVIKPLSAMMIVLASAASQAAPVLLGVGEINGSSDLSGLNYTLESGVSAAVLGGTGSGIAYAGGNQFYLLPDRGPNAQSYTNGALVDNTTSYIPRAHKISIGLSAASSGSLPLSVSAQLESTTLFYSSSALNYGNTAGLASAVPSINTTHKQYFSGRSDNFAPGATTNPNNARLDPEGIRISNNGKTAYISDEYGPYVYEFNIATGERLRTFNLPASLTAAQSFSTETAEISGNTAGRTTNKGMEGLAITPDGSKLVGIMQATALQDKSKNVRIVVIDIASGTTQEFAYKLTDGTGVSEILAINNNQFLVLERDGKGLGDGSAAVAKKLFQIDLTNAQSVAGLSGDLTSKAVAKTQFLDITSNLIAAGFSANQIPAKLEGIAFGSDVQLGNTQYHTLILANDNDYLNTVGGLANPNRLFVYGFTQADLPNYQPQAISSVPLPAGLPLLLTALSAMGMGFLRRKSV
ncbi:MAG TPA: esterase-like activity of phytase family protein [Cellvibrionaceae bacterium]|nr:esterase-like activity of phytase family protein [Cellvibrionaceae bacterium]HMW72078.1 esterase-like activity of phytase family protein [Cellvibrionaceae bacterium]HMY39322.1 esterase-like activity of phytase family protein [Marinagarivorans sp.]